MAKGLSVIVCCYNSAERLPMTLQHLARQKVSPDVRWEVILVNNASKDNTTEVAQETWNAFGSPVPFQIVDELIPGLSHARDKGFSNAQYEYLLLCDDDNWLHEDYVQLSYALMESNETIGVLGGCGIPELEDSAPGWFWEFADFYATGPQAPQSGEVHRRFVYGAGAVFRKSVVNYLKVNGFKSMLRDRTGEQLSSSGDIELCYAISLAGYRIWYESQLLFQHFIPLSRSQEDYFLRLNAGIGYASSLLIPYQLKLFNPDLPRYKYSFAWIFAIRLYMLMRFRLLSFVGASWFSSNPCARGRVIFLKDLHELRGLWGHKKGYPKILKQLARAAWLAPAYRANE